MYMPHTHRKKHTQKVPQRYIPKQLTRKDRKKQQRALKRSRRLYRQGKYYTRTKLSSFPAKVSPHILAARKVYNITDVRPSPLLAKKTGCSLEALQHIVKKGEGAYFSSGSRPNQSAQSWGYARLASSITGGKASAVDYSILKTGCKRDSKALKLAENSVHFKTHGTRRVPKVRL